MAGAENGSALQPGNFVHQAWTTREGAPPATIALAQAPDGYLWLGTGTGLYRFDGVTFSRYQPPPGKHLPSANITALKFTTGGALWVGFYDGGAAWQGLTRVAGAGGPSVSVHAIPRKT